MPAGFIYVTAHLGWRTQRWTRAFGVWCLAGAGFDRSRKFVFFLLPLLVLAVFDEPQRHHFIEGVETLSAISSSVSGSSGLVDEVLGRLPGSLFSAWRCLATMGNVGS